MNQAQTQILATIKKHVVILLVGFFVIASLGAYLGGYRVGPGLSFVKVGTLVLTGLPAGSAVYIDAVSRTIATGDVLELKLVPGSHSIIVDSDGQYPWNDVLVEPQKETILAPLLIPEKTRSRILTGENVVLAKVLEKNSTLPSKENPISFAESCLEISIQGNQIIAEPKLTDSCTPPSYLCIDGACTATVIFAPTPIVRSITKFPGREDALVIAYGDTIAVIEINPLTPQFFAPLYVGSMPKVFAWDDTSLIISNEGTFYRIGE